MLAGTRGIDMGADEKFSFDARTQEILEHLTIPFAVYQYIDKRVVTIALSQGFCDEFGFQKLEDAYFAMDNDMYRATHPDDKTRVADAAYRFAAFGIPYDIVYRTRTLKDQDYIILHAFGKSVYPKPGVRLCLTWYAYEGHYSPEQGTYESVLNQTLNRFLTEESQYRGMYYDYMTGLPNMAYFYELAEAGRQRMRDKGEDSAIVFFNLTGLKTFDRRHGFAEGDRLISAIAVILAKHFSSESCARFTKDHFAAFAPEKGLEARLEAVIAECAAANEGKTLPLRIGVYPDRIEEVEIGTACDRARLAADSRKVRGESYYSFFDMDMMQDEKNRQAIIDNLDTAIEEGWIKVHYQPIVHTISGKVCNAEALARWDDPVRGLLPPSSFIPVLEEAMLIHKLDLCVLKQTLDNLNRNEEYGISTVAVSINISRADFDVCDMVQEVCAMVDEAGVDRGLINIEITESTVGSDFDYIKKQIGRFRERGFHVWMDDFGSGYSSLDLLQDIPVDLIKFNMGFMRQFDDSEKSRIILTNLMGMAKNLGIDTIVEGVETREQALFLREIGCSKIQGFYYSKPEPMERYLEKHRKGENIPTEDPQESDYYSALGKLNLHDPMGLSGRSDEEGLSFNLDIMPMAILEWKDGVFTLVRCNQPYRLFLQRVYHMDLSETDLANTKLERQPSKDFADVAMRGIETGRWEKLDADFEDRLQIRAFIRKVAVNSTTGAVAISVLVFSVLDKDC